MFASDWVVWRTGLIDCLVSLIVEKATLFLMEKIVTYWEPKLTAEEMSDKLWWTLVVGECKRRKIAEWFYADRETWIEEHKNRLGQLPLEAIQTNLDSL